MSTFHKFLLTILVPTNQKKRLLQETNMAKSPRFEQTLINPFAFSRIIVKVMNVFLGIIKGIGEKSLEQI